MTQEEFHQQFNLGKFSNAEFAKLSAQERLSSNFKTMDARHLVEDRPAEVNWIALGGVTPVKNQVRTLRNSFSNNSDNSENLKSMLPTGIEPCNNSDNSFLATIRKIGCLWILLGVFDYRSLGRCFVYQYWRIGGLVGAELVGL